MRMLADYSATSNITLFSSLSYVPQNKYLYLCVNIAVPWVATSRVQVQLVVPNVMKASYSRTMANPVVNHVYLVSACCCVVGVVLFVSSNHPSDDTLNRQICGCQWHTVQRVLHSLSLRQWTQHSDYCVFICAAVCATIVVSPATRSRSTIAPHAIRVSEVPFNLMLAKLSVNHVYQVFDMPIPPSSPPPPCICSQS